MTKICLVRHGETDWNVARRLQGREDIPLNEAGVAQAEAAAAFLAPWGWTAVVTSPLSRARRTAEIIASRAGCSVEVEPGFIERHYGEASGLTPEERDARFPPGGIPAIEPFEEVRARAWEALAGVVRRHEGGSVVIVTHSSTGRSIPAMVSDGAVGGGPPYLKNGCFTLFSWREGKLGLICYNKAADELPDTIDWTNTQFEKEMSLEP